MQGVLKTLKAALIHNIMPTETFDNNNNNSNNKNNVSVERQKY